MNKLKRLGQVVFVFLLLFSIVTVGAIIEYQRVVAREKENLEDDLLIVKNNIEQMITSRMINARGLAGFIEVSEDMTDEAYDVFAGGIYESTGHIVKDVVLITDTTISHVYPTYYGIGAIGIDLAQVEAQKDVLLYTKETGKAVFIGPVDLVEGGRGIIVRVPVHVKDQYFGQVAIVFDYYNFIENSGLKKLVNTNYVALSGNDPTSEETFMIWYNARDINANCVYQTIEMENIQWVIRACPANGWNGFSTLFYAILVFGFIVSLLAALIYNQQLVFKEALIASNNQLRHIAEHDTLTNLWNRRKFGKTIQTNINGGKRGSVVLLDLDNFKNINDTHGHIYGDSLLMDCAKIIQTIIGDRGAAYRFGGDEFLIHFEGQVEESSIDSYLRLITNALSSQEVEGIRNHVTNSAGIVTYPEDGMDVEALLIKADVAMYKAKSDGKNCHVFFVETLLSDFDVKVTVEKTLRKALEEDGFTIHYQPIVDIHYGRVTSFEALIRLKDFQYGPMTFIPVAEESGLIIPLGLWIIEEVAKQLKSWRHLGLDVKPVAINLSPKQLLEDDFIDNFLGILERFDIPMTLIQVEITESVLLENEDENVLSLNKLHNAGIKISMDDFGTGYSSLNYLTYLPVDKVKLDKSLKDKFINMKNSKVMSGIIDMSHGLNLEVVAEGVEDGAEWQKLKEAGCDYLQGYYFSKPVPPSKAVGLINRQFGRT